MSYETTSLTLNNEAPFSSPASSPSSSADAKQISKLILRSALQKANAAVQCDSTNDVLGAINAYKEAISLLERVLGTVDKENDRRRLQEIHDSYSERIRLLSTITSKLEPDSSLYQLSTPKKQEATAEIESEEEIDAEEEELKDADDEEEDEEEEEVVIQKVVVEKSWLSSKPTIRTSRPSSRQQQHQPIIIKKMSSTSSMDKSFSNTSSPPTTPSSTTPTVRYVSQQQKEKLLLLSKLPVSPPPPLPLPPAPTTSKSTPIKKAEKEAPEGFDIDQDEMNLLGRKQQQQQVVEPTIPIPNSSNRDSVSSMDSSVSGNSVASSIESTMCEQPTMALPSLKNDTTATTSTNTPIPVKKSASNNVFRARTSSLPKSPTSPIMQRSSSMSTVETLFGDEENEQQKAVIVQHQQQPSPPPPPLIINRPIISRPSLGSMRKKAANRLSMDAFTLKKSGGAVNSSGSSPNSYGLFLKDEMDYDHRDMPHHPTSSTVQQYQQQYHQEQQHQQEFAAVESSGHLKLLLALEKSMLEGAHITQRLYIPKNLWQQPNIRLSSMDIKVSACEQLMNDIARLENWSYLDDLVNSTRLLDNFGSSVDTLQQNLQKKLKRDSMAANEASGATENNNSPSSASSIHSSGSSIMSNSTMSSRDSMATIGRMDSGKKTQSFMSWGTKLTKSVERMNAFSLTKTEDQYRHYIEVLQKLFLKIHILENWLNHYNLEKRKSAVRQPQHDVLIMKLVKICTVINHVVGGFVIRDITILLAKWLKRGGSWVNE